MLPGQKAQKNVNKKAKFNKSFDFKKKLETLFSLLFMYIKGGNSNIWNFLCTYIIVSNRYSVSSLIILTKSHNDRAKIANFLLAQWFGTSLFFIGTVSIMLHAHIYSQSCSTFLSFFNSKYFHSMSEIIDLNTHHLVVSLEVTTNQLTNLFFEHILGTILRISQSWDKRIAEFSHKTTIQSNVIVPLFMKIVVVSEL